MDHALGAHRAVSLTFEPIGDDLFAQVVTADGLADVEATNGVGACCLEFDTVCRNVIHVEFIAQIDCTNGTEYLGVKIVTAIYNDNRQTVTLVIIFDDLFHFLLCRCHETCA